jgi:hypothetical protein
MPHPHRNGDVATDRPMSFALRLVKSTRIFVADAECKVIGISASIISKKRTPYSSMHCSAMWKSCQHEGNYDIAHRGFFH